MMKKCLATLLILLLLPWPAVLAEREAIPDALRFTQKNETEKVSSSHTVKRTYPTTANEQVNREMRALIDGLAEQTKPYLPEGKGKAYLDVGATVFRTGDRYMSFLTVARVVKDQKQLYADCAARVYDMTTGEQAELTWLFPEDSPAWALLESEIRRQITDYFMEEAPDKAALDALCDPEAVKNAPFTLSPGKLSLHYQAARVYPGKETLMHVDVYYPDLREYMTEQGLAMTDVSRYRLIALTYDDGPGRNITMALLNQLRQHGAVATFFVVGTQFRANNDVIRREHDEGHTVASHNMIHTYTDITEKNVAKWRKQFDERLDALIGRRAEIMRAPGGSEMKYIEANVGLPLIHWSRSANDAPSGGRTEGEIFATIRAGLKDSVVLLMHDPNPYSAVYSAKLLDTLEKKNYLCVTVQELFSIYGIALEPNHYYSGCEREAAQGK